MKQRLLKQPKPVDVKPKPIVNTAPTVFQRLYPRSIADKVLDMDVDALTGFDIDSV
jgi:hypothetical protein